MPGLGLSLRLGRTKKSGSLPTGEATVAALEAQAASDGYTAFSGDVKDASVVLVDSLVADGVWDKAELLAVYATNGDSDFALYNWVEPTGSNNGTAFNSPTFTSLQGFTGNGSNMYITHGNLSSKSSLTDVSFGFYKRNSSASFISSIGSSDGSTLRIGSAAGNGYYRVNGGPSSTGVPIDSNGFFLGSRTAADAVALYANGVENDSATTAATANANTLVDVLRRTTSYSADQIAIVWKGQGLNSIEQASLYNAIQAYMTTLGTQV